MFTVTMLTDIVFMLIGFTIAFVPKMIKLLFKFIVMSWKLRKYEKDS